MPKEFMEFDMTKPPGASWGIRIGGGVDRGKVLVIEKVRFDQSCCCCILFTKNVEMHRSFSTRLPMIMG